MENSFRRNKSDINKLVDIKDECLDDIELVALDDPREPIMSVNDRILAIRNGVHNYRTHYILPMAIGFWCFLFFVVSDLGPSSSEIKFARSILVKYETNSSLLSERNYNYYKTMLGEDKNSGILDYIKAAHLYGGETHQRRQNERLLIILVLFTISVVLTYWYLRFRIMAYLFFDREKQIVYTWRKGRVAACRFESIGFREETLGLRLFLYGEKKKTDDGYTYKEAEFLIQPSESMFFNSKQDNNLLFAQLFAFMGTGKQAVIKDAHFEREMPRTWQAKDQQPEDFDARLEEILKREHELPQLYLKRFI
ncbi:hypothetical protein [Vibrio campbellii]|uniref:hypothetical protein n=1 Tax=Vibrio campbellii TaxID=680 RepID=UPI00210C16B9|nr:hypothetical protein [Vibrio campbellii]UTZ21886.1 hypothetical protein HB760_08145 [Vibrio campbellii]